MTTNSRLFAFALAAGVLGAAGTEAATVDVQIRNLTATGGLAVTPFWVGFHDGSFDLYDRGAPASPGLERLAEDGNTQPLSDEFATFGAGSDGVVPGAAGVIVPGETASASFQVDPTSERFFSYATMVVPSNDAFLANGNPVEHKLFGQNGGFLGPVRFLLTGANVLDAGTEANDESFGVAFLNQTMPNEGTPTPGGVVELHPGFAGSFANPGGTPGILGATNAMGFTFDPLAADFTRGDLALLEVVVTPIPGAVLLLAPALLGLGALARRRSAAAA